MKEYQEVPAGTVPGRSRRAADDALSYARSELDLPADLGIRWFDGRAAGTADLAASLLGTPMVEPPGAFECEVAILGATAVVDDNAIWIRVHQTPRRTAEVTFHECHHAFARAFIGEPHGAIEYDGREQLACAYERGHDWVAALIAGKEFDHGY